MRLRLAGTSLADVSRELEVSPTTVTSVSQGYRRSRRIESAIASKLGVLPQQLWPDRYPGGGTIDGGGEQAPQSRTIDCAGRLSASPAYC